MKRKPQKIEASLGELAPSDAAANDTRIVAQQPPSAMPTKHPYYGCDFEPKRVLQDVPPCDRITVIEAEPGKVFTKRYLPDGTKISFDRVSLVRIHEFDGSTFEATVNAFVWCVGKPTFCPIRGVAVDDCPRFDATDVDPWVYRRSRDDERGPASIVDTAHRWVVLDFDDTSTPFDLADPKTSVARWRETLAPELAAARGAFFLSASSHTSPNVRGKLLVWYEHPIDKATAKALANHYGADDCLAVAVQPHYVAAPIFVGVDPLQYDRGPMMFDGVDAVLPDDLRVAVRGAAPSPASRPPDVDALTDEQTEQCDRAIEAIEPRYADGTRHHLGRAIAAYMRHKRMPKLAAEYVLAAVAENTGSNVADALARARWTYDQATHPAGASALRALDPALLAALDGIFVDAGMEAFAERLRERATAATTAATTTDATPAPKRKPVVMLERTDTGNARRLVAMFGDRIRYVSARRTWLTWTGARWEDDETNVVEMYAKQAAESLWFAANDLPEDQRGAARQWAAKSLDRSRIASMIALAQTEPGVAVTVAQLDADPYLLNVANGTLDLRTMTLSAPDPALLMTKSCAANFDINARSDLWEAFVSRTMGGDADLSAYVQRALGYALIGAWHEKAFWFGFGEPDGGKSTLLGVVGDVLGSYHVSVKADTWLKQNVGGNRDDLARLLGARLATTLEFQREAKFDESLVKGVTGGDTIVCAAKYERTIQFPPTFALWMGANDRPRIRDDDAGMWSRMRCVPFTHGVPKGEQDPYLRGKLTGPEHAPAVLRWLAHGCAMWQSEGLGTCTAVDGATGDYRTSMNPLLDFAESELVITHDSADEIPARAMRSRYEAWARERRIMRPLKGSGFGRRLRDLGVLGGDDSTRHVVAGANSFPGGGKAPMDRHWQGVRFSE